MKRREFLAAVAAAGGCGYARFGLGVETEPKSADTQISKRRLGQTGVDVTVLAIGGVAGMSRRPTPEFDPAQLAEAALDAGITYFDTAAAYGGGQSERNYGQVIARRRSEVFLATKTAGRTYDAAMRDVESSLKRLRTDRVDLIQIHDTHAAEDLTRWGKSDGVLAALRKLRDQKVTRFIGVTGHEEADVMCRAISMYDFDTILTTFNPTRKRRSFAEKVLPVANEKKMGIVAMKVMGGGLGSLAAGNPIKNDGIARHDEARRQADPGTLIRYVLGLPITVAVVGMGSLEELRVNVQAVRGPAPLDDRQRKVLEMRTSS